MLAESALDNQEIKSFLRCQLIFQCLELDHRTTRRGKATLEHFQLRPSCSTKLEYVV